MIAYLNEREINAVFHYAPLHDSAAGRRYARAGGPLPATETSADRLVRLPLWPGMTETDVAQVIDGLRAAVSGRAART